MQSEELNQAPHFHHYTAKLGKIDLLSKKSPAIFSHPYGNGLKKRPFPPFRHVFATPAALLHEAIRKC